MSHDASLRMTLNIGFIRDQDFQYRPAPLQGQHIARRADVTLAAFDDFQMDYTNYYDLDLGPDEGIGSQDYELPLDFGPQPGAEESAEGSEAPGPEDETMSVEVGRRAVSPRAPRESLDSRLLGRGRDDLDILSAVSRAVSEHPFDDFGLGAGGMVIEGLTFEPEPVLEPEPELEPEPMVSDREKTPGQTSRACGFTHPTPWHTTHAPSSLPSYRTTSDSSRYPSYPSACGESQATSQGKESHCR